MNHNEDLKSLITLLKNDDHIETDPLTSVLRNFRSISGIYYKEIGNREIIIDMLGLLGIEVIKVKISYYVDHIHLQKCISPEHYEALDQTVYPNFLDHASAKKFDDEVFS